jgi:hypothetical protein
MSNQDVLEQELWPDKNFLKKCKAIQKTFFSVLKGKPPNRISLAAYIENEFLFQYGFLDKKQP